MSIMKKRIQWVDVLKGITILLVIIGHTVSGVLRTIIFSFHMPLFFALSGYTYKAVNSYSGVFMRMKKNIKHLFGYAYLIWFIRLLLLLIRDGKTHSLHQIILSAIYASGTNYLRGHIDVPAFGMMWFLVVLFFIRTIYDVWNWKLNNEIIKCIGVLGVCFLGLFVNSYLPFSFDVAMVSLVFFYAGHKLQVIDLKTKAVVKVLVSGMTWGGILLIIIAHHRHFELAARDYPYGFGSIIMAITGCICLITVTSNLTMFHAIQEGFAAIGRNSLTLFTIHAFDIIWFPYLKSVCGNSKLLLIFFRLMIDLIILFLVMKTKSLKLYKQ